MKLMTLIAVRILLLILLQSSSVTRYLDKVIAQHVIIRYLFILSLCYCATSCAQPNIAQNNENRGYVFRKGQHTDLSAINDFSERFTPSPEEINKVERLIRAQLESINKSLINQGRDCPIIHKSLQKYKRQYIGYLNTHRERIVWVNFIWDDAIDNPGDLKKEILIHFDGCSRYWNIKVNITKGKLYDLFINGSA